MKKVLAFDMDDTLAVSKTPLAPHMSDILRDVLRQFDVCVISGAKFETLDNQIIQGLEGIDEQQRAHLHLMPTCGTRYYRFNEAEQQWQPQYAEDLSEDEKQRIIAALEQAAKELDLWEPNPVGEIIEDRLSQVTYSALGQKVAPEPKYAWDPDGSKKRALQKRAAELLPEFAVGAAGTTSIDVTRPGIDKGYGINKLIDVLGITAQDVLFFGDKLEPGGNDYPVIATGADTVAVTRWEDTAVALEAILKVTK